MALPEFTLRQLLEAGVHFGHQTHRWNPRMGPYIYGDRNGIHILDLTQTVPLLDQALHAVQQTVAKGGRILFVGTKRQAQKAVADAAERSAQYYMNHRWLGGTLTNWKTISQSISRLKSIDEKLASGASGLTKKERLGLEREQNKLQQSLGGIREMGGTPDMIFVIDTNKEDLAILEARKLGIPVIAVLDFEFLAGRHRLSDPRQRRRGAGDRALLRPDRARGARRHGGADGRGRRRHRRAGGGAGRGGRRGRGRGSPRNDPAHRPRSRGRLRGRTDFQGDFVMSITATMVKELRDVSGAGMMDAKKALTETGGDMEAAIDWLRTKGLAKAAKKAGRTAAEGLVGVAVKGGVGVAVEVNSETDFVARNSDFQAIVRAIAEVATGCADIEALRGAQARRQDRRGGGHREDHHHRREPAPAAHGGGRGRERRLLRPQRGRPRAWARSACWWR